MAIVQGRARTANASRYLQQLCKHWSHKFDVDFSKHRGEVRFSSAVATLEASADALLVTIETIETSESESIDSLKAVLVDHLDRFAFREAPLSFTWASRPS